jgi:hypothetical protein
MKKLLLLLGLMACGQVQSATKEGQACVAHANCGSGFLCKAGICTKG